MPRLSVPQIDGSGRLGLALHGQPGSNYLFEISRNLRDWVPLDTRLATNGEADLRYTPPTNSRALFFRGRQVVSSPALNVQIQADTNSQSVTLVTQDSGGSLSLIDARGVTYLLTVPPLAMADSVMLTMTAVTNLTGLPFAAGYQAAVLIGPDGIHLAQPAQLLILFPTNQVIDTHKLAAYAFNSDGSRLRLVPEMISSNSVALPLASLSSAGCSVATVPEILLQAQRSVADSNGTSVALASPITVTKKGVFYDTCYPAEKTRAVFVGKGVENAANASSQAVAARITANNQASGDGQLSLGELGLTDAYNSFYNDVLSQYAAEVQTNCALAGTLIPYVLGAERQAALMGVESSIPDSFLNLCAEFSYCALKIDECCKTKGASQEALVELIGLSRQWNLLGCDTTDPWQYCPDCFPGWYGTVKYHDTMTYYESFGGGSEADSQYEFTATLYAPTNLVGSSAGQGYYGVTGNVTGQAEGKNRFHTFQPNNNGCYTYVDTLRTSALSDTATALLQIVWSITNNPGPGPVSGLLLFPDSPTLQKLVAVPAVMTETDQNAVLDEHGNCQPVWKESTTYPTDTYPMVQVIYNSTTITGSLNSVTGSWSTNWIGLDGAQWTREITWDLHRGQP